MIRKNQIKSLLSEDIDPAVSIYLPTHKAGPAMREDPIRLKNLLREAEKQIGHAPTAEKILEPGWNLVGREREWKHMEHGLALFLSRKHHEMLNLEYGPPETAVVQSGFYLKPLYRVLDDGQRFYLLVLDRKAPRLYLCSRNEFNSVAEDVMRESFRAIVEKSEVADNVGSHSASSAGGVQFHSQGESPDDYKKVELDRFVLGVAEGVSDALRQETAPLVVAGEPMMLGLFRDHDRYGNTLADSVKHGGKPGEEAAIYQQALDLVTPLLNAPRDAAFAKLEELGNRNPGQVVTNHEDILRDAASGRVETLLIAEDAELWGRMVADDRTKIMPLTAEGAVDLIDRMASRTLAGDGKILVVSRQDLPGNAHAVGILRY